MAADVKLIDRGGADEKWPDRPNMNKFPRQPQTEREREREIVMKRQTRRTVRLWQANENVRKEIGEF
jgi:hypothetical protein